MKARAIKRGRFRLGCGCRADIRAGSLGLSLCPQHDTDSADGINVPLRICEVLIYLAGYAEPRADFPPFGVVCVN